MMPKVIAGATLDRATLVQAGIGFVLLVAVIGVLLGPVRGLFRAVEEDTIEQEKKMDRNLRILSPAAKEAVLKDYQRYGDALRKKGSTAEESAAMLAEVERLAKQAQIRLAATKPREPRLDPDYEQYAVEMEFEADVAQMIGFLYAIETSPRMLRVDRLSLDTKGTRSSGGLKSALVVSRVVTL